MTLTRRGELAAITAAITISAASMTGLVWFLIWLGTNANTGGFIALGLLGATVAAITWRVLRLPDTAPLVDDYNAHREEAEHSRWKRH